MVINTSLSMGNSAIITCGYLIYDMVTMANSNIWNLLGDCSYRHIN